MFDLNDEQVTMLLHEAVLSADKTPEAPEKTEQTGAQADADGQPQTEAQAQQAHAHAQAQAHAHAQAQQPQPQRAQLNVEPGQARIRAEAEEECRAIQAEIADAEAELANLQMNGGPAEDAENIRAELQDLHQELIQAQLRVGQRPQASTAAAHPTLAGQKVKLTPNWQDYSNARQGGRGLAVDEVGEVIECRSVRSKNWCHVRVGAQHDEAGGSWWYEVKALFVCRSARLLPKKLQEGADREKWEGMFSTEVLEDLVKGDGMTERLRAIEAKYVKHNVA